MFFHGEKPSTKSLKFSILLFDYGNKIDTLNILIEGPEQIGAVSSESTLFAITSAISDTLYTQMALFKFKVTSCLIIFTTLCIN